jgi:hypothetical protein
MRFFEVGVQPVGFIALGALPTGVIAIGQGATGVVAVGQLARGVVAVGQLSLGVFAFGQLALGAAWAGGQVALGGTQGLAMIGWGAVGDWLPWKRGALEVRPARGLWSVALRAAFLAGLAALVAWAVLVPVVDALARVGGVFVPVPGMS